MVTIHATGGPSEPKQISGSNASEQIAVIDPVCENLVDLVRNSDSLGVKAITNVQAFAANQTPDPRQRFINEIVEPMSFISGSDGIIVDYDENKKQPFVSITTLVKIDGKTYNPSYVIYFSNDVVTPKLPGITTLDKPNVARLPAKRWDTKELQDVWRCLTIANPKLYPRFLSKEIKPEYFQLGAIKEVGKSIKEKRRALIVMATGLGKTPVAFWGVDDLIENIDKTKPEDGVVLFIVNNKIILGEAEEKLIGDGEENEGLFKDKYSTSYIYGGIEDFSGDYIFCTPSSLMSGSYRLSKLLAYLLDEKKKIHAVVFDETHHTPAESHKKVFLKLEEMSERNHWDTAFYGLTATDIRTDRQSLLPFFGGELSFEFSISDGWGGGFLTPVEYIGAFEDRLGPYFTRGLLDPEKLDKPKQELYYGEDRFAELLGTYKKHTAGCAYNKSLLKCPDTERADDLAAYFKSNGINAVALHSKVDDEILNDHYYALKRGKWPPKSNFQNELIPECIMCDSLFKEGTDAAGINHIFIWDDIGSTVDFAQLVGRGLRPYPGKTHLKVIDCCGVLNKAPIMHYLASQFIEIKARKSLRKKEAEDQAAIDEELSSIPEKPITTEPPKPPPTRNFFYDYFHGTPDDDALYESNLYFSQDLTTKYKSYIENYPILLEHRYGSYSNIPTKDRINLDRFFARKLGLPDSKELRGFYGYIETIASRLSATDLAEQEIIEFRRSMIPIFCDDSFLDPDKEFTPNMPFPLSQRGFIIFNRFQDLFTFANSELTEENIYRLFPEYNPKQHEISSIRAKNLRLLRTEVFHKNPVDMIEEFLNAVSKDSLDRSTASVLEYTEEELFISREPKCYLILGAEGKRIDSSEFEELSGISTSGSKKLRTAASVYYQDSLINLYLAHPNISKTNLRKDDFDMPEDQFTDRLIELSLARLDLKTKQFIEFLDKYLDEYYGCIASTDQEVLKLKRDKLLNLLSSRPIIRPFRVTNNECSKLIASSEKFDGILTNLGNRKSDDDTKIRTALDNLLNSSGVEYRANLSEILNDGCSMTLRRNGDLGSYEVCIVSLEHQDLPPLKIKVSADQEHRWTAYLCNMKGTELYVNNLEAQYAKLFTSQKVLFREAFVELIDKLKDIYGEELVFVIPKDSNGNCFYTDTYNLILSDTNFNVLGQINTVSTSVTKENFDFDYESIKRSRVDFLTPATLARYRKKYDFKKVHPSNLLSYVYMTITDMRDVILPSWDRTRENLAKVDIDSSSEITQRALAHFVGRVHEQLEKNVTGIIRRKILKAVFNILQPYTGTAPTEDQILIATMYLIVSFRKEIKGPQFELRDKLFVLGANFSGLVSQINPQNSHMVDPVLVKSVSDLSRKVIEHYIAPNPGNNNLPQGGLPSDISFSEADELRERVIQLARELTKYNKINIYGMRETSREGVFSGATPSEAVSAPATSLRLKLEKPPYLDGDGNVILWLEKGKSIKNTSKKDTGKFQWLAHWNPNCNVLRISKKDKAQANSDRITYEKFRMCSDCSPSFKAIMGQYQKQGGIKLSNENIGEINKGLDDAEQLS